MLRLVQLIVALALSVALIVMLITDTPRQRAVVYAPHHSVQQTAAHDTPTPSAFENLKYLVLSGICISFFVYVVAVFCFWGRDKLTKAQASKHTADNSARLNTIMAFIFGIIIGFVGHGSGPPMPGYQSDGPAINAPPPIYDDPGRPTLSPNERIPQPIDTHAAPTK